MLANRPRRHQSSLADRVADKVVKIEPHPDLTIYLRIGGTAHTTGGRFLPSFRTAATSFDEQEALLADPLGWERHVQFDPLGSAIDGARGYSAKMGLPDPHRFGYDHVRQDIDTVRNVGRHYDSLPEFDQRAVPSFQAMARETGNQYDYLTNGLGVKVHTVDHDPYADVHEMMEDLRGGNLQVLGTHVTGGHPVFGNEVNDKFRAVHDYFGHAATGRSFDRHGEQAAYLAHSQMFTPQARPALASETKGQNTSLILNGNFGPQRIALMDQPHWDDSSLRGIDPNYRIAAH